MKKIFFLTLILILFSLAIPLFLPKKVLAQNALLSNTPEASFSTCKKGEPGCPASGGGCIETGNCEVKDFTVLMIRVAQIILGLTGSLALLAFVYGGTLFLMSSGNKEMVEKGKNTLIGAVIGIFIVFASYTIIGFMISAFNPEIKDAWSSSSWFPKQ